MSFDLDNKMQKTVSQGNFIFYGYALNIKRVFMYKAIIIKAFLIAVMCPSIINCGKRKQDNPQRALTQEQARSKEYLKLNTVNPKSANKLAEKENVKFLLAKKRYLLKQKIREKNTTEVNGMAVKTSKKSTINPYQCNLCGFISYAKKGEYNLNRHKARVHRRCPQYCQGDDPQRCKQFHNIIVKLYRH